jgi:hypothetical protein
LAHSAKLRQAEEICRLMDGRENPPLELAGLDGFGVLNAMRGEASKLIAALEHQCARSAPRYVGSAMGGGVGAGSGFF